MCLAVEPKQPSNRPGYNETAFNWHPSNALSYASEIGCKGYFAEEKATPRCSAERPWGAYGT